MRALAFWPSIRTYTHVCIFECWRRKIDVCGSPGSHYNQHVLYKPVPALCRSVTVLYMPVTVLYMLV